jgi:hypothetical protein
VRVFELFESRFPVGWEAKFGGVDAENAAIFKDVDEALFIFDVLGEREILWRSCRLGGG